MALSGVSPSCSSGTPCGREPERAPEPGQRVDVPGGLVPEAEVVADDDGRGVQAVDERMVHELVRRHLRELERERQRAEHVDAELLDQFGPPHDAGQHRRVRAGPHDLGRVRHERDQHAGHAAVGGHLHGVADDRLVPAVDAVEHPDGDDAVPPAGGHRVQSMPALHAGEPNRAGRPRRTPGRAPCPAAAADEPPRDAGEQGQAPQELALLLGRGPVEDPADLDEQPVLRDARAAALARAAPIRPRSGASSTSGRM